VTIKALVHQGVLIGDSTLPGETRADGSVPAHPNGIRVSRTRWLILYATRSFRGVDDDRSILWQLRDGAATGRVLKEGVFARSVNDWDPLGDGRACVKQHGHPVAFGVPKGAAMNGRPAPHANLFVAKWRRVARRIDPATGEVLHARTEPQLRDQTLGVEWVQFRLNVAEDDLEILEPPQTLRQRGFEEGPRFTGAPGVTLMNQSFVQAVPFNADATEWADANHFDHRQVAVLKYRYDLTRHRYDWVETGPLMGPVPGPNGHLSLIEASLAPVDRPGSAGGSWIISARTEGRAGPAWVRADDPFTYLPSPVIGDSPLSSSPSTLYLCPDGQLRIFGGDPRLSPYGRPRDPLYCWDVNPLTFAVVNPRVVLDTVQAGLPLRAEAIPVADMCKLLPHQGGATQDIVHRLRVRAIDRPYVDVVMNEAERDATAIYHAQVTYDRPYPDPWEWGY
jgi:hypothetical protein